jgi:hypothetical protein
VGTAVVLTLTTKWANQQALSMDLSHVQRVLFADAAYFVANCVTFLTRFLIFHYVLFKDRGTKVSELLAELPASERPGAWRESANGAESANGTGSANGAQSTADGVVASEPFAPAGSSAGVNGSSAWAGNASGRSPRRVPARDDAALPEPGSRR